MRYVNATVLSGADNASQNGGTIDSNQLIAASFQAVFGDSTAVGTFKLQGSNDISTAGNMASPSNFQPTNWTDIPQATVSISAGGTAVIILTQIPMRWIRAIFTHTSGGSSTINVNMFAQSI